MFLVPKTLESLSLGIINLGSRLGKDYFVNLKFGKIIKKKKRIFILVPDESKTHQFLSPFLMNI